MIKAVLDTSVFVAALISSKQNSAPMQVLNIWRGGQFTLVMFPQLFLAAAYESKANYLVSLDKKHLLPLKHYHGTQIIEPGLFIRLLSTGRQY